MKTIHTVDADFIDSLNESAKSCHPDEFFCMVRQKNGVVNELVLVPGTICGSNHCVFSEWMSPIDFSIVGTAHSHPERINKASDEDLTLFANLGGIHFITCQPYDRNSWKAYNSKGKEIIMEIVGQ